MSRLETCQSATVEIDIGDDNGDRQRDRSSADTALQPRMRRKRITVGARRAPDIQRASFTAWAHANPAPNNMVVGVTDFSGT